MPWMQLGAYTDHSGRVTTENIRDRSNCIEIFAVLCYTFALFVVFLCMFSMCYYLHVDNTNTPCFKKLCDFFDYHPVLFDSPFLCIDTNITTATNPKTAIPMPAKESRRRTTYEPIICFTWGFAIRKLLLLELCSISSAEPIFSERFFLSSNNLCWCFLSAWSRCLNICRC